MIKKGKIIKYQELKKIKAGENKEPLVVLNNLFPKIICSYQKKDMFKYVNDKILVREGLAIRLQRANQELRKEWPAARLKVVYGYRHLDVQKKYFLKIKNRLQIERSNWSEKKILAAAHNFVAVPNVAGHIVGGAIDITIESKGKELDMGTKIADYRDPEKIKTFSKKITKEQLANRLLLLDLLKKFGFAPFYGEWWHFSYGDKEWALFYNKKKSLYSEIEL